MKKFLLASVGFSRWAWRRHRPPIFRAVISNAGQGAGLYRACLTLDRRLYRHQRRRRLGPFGFLRRHAPTSFNTSGAVAGGTLGYN